MGTWFSMLGGKQDPHGEKHCSWHGLALIGMAWQPRWVSAAPFYPFLGAFQGLGWDTLGELVLDTGEEEVSL